MTSSTPAGPAPESSGLGAAQRLLDHLNRWGPVWGSVTAVAEPGCDGRLLSRDGSIAVDLRLVALAPTDGNAANAFDAAAGLTAAITAASTETGDPAAGQARPWLVVDAGGIPEVALNAIRRQVRGALPEHLGFRQVWVVGADTAQVWQAFGPPPSDVTAPIW